MTPQARAVAAFTLAVLLLTGHLNRLAAAAYVATGGTLPGSDGGRLVLGLLTVLVAAGVLWFTHTAAVEELPGWQAHLAQAGRFLAAVGLVIAVLSTIAAITSNEPYVSIL
jgi:hypothetical protein